MAATIVADYIESVLLEIEHASRDLADSAAKADSSPDEVEQALLQALETARRVLEGALDHAQKNGVPKLAIDAP